MQNKIVNDTTKYYAGIFKQLQTLIKTFTFGYSLS